MRAAHVAISRDPFSRSTLIRETLSLPRREPCAWCGAPARFRYGTERDGVLARVWWDERVFCSRDCRRQFFAE